VGALGIGANGIGDLIEMTDEFEIGGDEDERDESGNEESRRGRQGSVVHVGATSSSATSYFDGVTARERSKGGKSGKDD